MYVSKITPKLLGVSAPGQSYTVAGFVASAVETKTQFGESTKFRGDFTAISDKGELTSSVMFAPKILEDYLLANFSGEDTFAFVIEVSTIADASVKSGYRYAIEMLAEESETPSAKLLKSVTKKK